MEFSRRANTVVLTKTNTQLRAVRASFPLRKLPTVGNLPYRVLLVAEENVHTQLIRMILLSNDIRVIASRNATETTEAITAELPHLILMDWDDGIDGRAILRAVKTNHETRKVPVLVMTDRVVTENLIHELGMYGVQWILEKPIVPLSLPRLIIRTLRGISSAGEPRNCKQAILVDCGDTASSALWNSVV